MSETSILLGELRQRVRRFVEMAARIGVSPEELAEEALKIWPPPAGEGGRALDERVRRMTLTSDQDERVIRAATLVPSGRAKAFEAAQAAFAFRDRLAAEHGGPFSDSTELIREDRER
ncbi:MAG: hypothetical protein ACOCX2_12555 [Armatimonadota bacterium]